ncbi:MAG: DUF749 domain-containing protein [Methanobacteriaceae archaeon]|nr:DUF749 domain-containing protein [Methanobacteriaceae archaeon]
MFVAILIGIFKYEELPEKYIPFVQYKASLEDKTISEDEMIAILNIRGTESHHVLFLSSYKHIKEIVAELKEADAEINYTTKKILEGHL